MNILHVVGARPNFMKLAPVYRALEQKAIFRQTIVHTGQHYDRAMSDVFLRELCIPEPAVNLQVGSASHAQQTAGIMARLEPALLHCQPDLVLVYGDVNSTAAAALVCAKLQIRVGHVEAGLRSFDRRMPEEINRVVTDSLADLLFTPSQDANDNLRREGADPAKIFFVGNVMIDTLVQLLPECLSRNQRLMENLGLSDYGVVTLHRPSNVDDPEGLLSTLAALDEVSRDLPLVFPLHPRTRRNLGAVTTQFSPHLRFIQPLGYLDFLGLTRRAKVVITDSGGIQEETTWLGVPCFTLRENTERPVTVHLGTNVLVGRDMSRLKEGVRRVLAGDVKKGGLPPLWDGNAAGRIADVICSGMAASFPAHTKTREAFEVASGGRLA